MPKKRSSAAQRQATHLESFAEDLGRMLGTAENKARGWLDQRKAIVRQLSQLREKTDSLLRELTESGANMVVAVGLARGKRGRPPGSGKKTAKKRGRTFTAAQRKEQGERMRAYWAAKRKAATKKSGLKRGGAVGNG
jgi:hypothetical protein